MSLIRIIGYLLLVAALCNLYEPTNCTSGSGFSDQEGSGPEDIQYPTEFFNDAFIPSSDCNVPVYSSINFERTFTRSVTENHPVIVEGKCYMMCIQQVHQDYPVNVNSNTDFPPWPFFILGQNCNRHAWLHECTRGCVIRNTASMDSTQCERLCKNDCSSECDGPTCNSNPDSEEWWVRTNCLFHCTLKNCRHGCNVTVLRSGEAPLSPEAPPMLTAANETNSRAGVYHLNISHSVPTSAPDSQLRVVFLFEILDHFTQYYSYHWETDPLRNMLDLADFACRNVSVRFAVLNQLKLSSFSPYTNIGEVYGDDVLRPSPISGVRVTQQDDIRLGFFGHVTWNISWDHPSSQLHLEGYNVVVYAGSNTNCGRRVWSMQIDSKDELTVLVAAQSPGELLIMGCSQPGYIIEVHSVGTEENDTYSETHAADIFPSDPRYSFITDLQCSKIWDPVKLAYSLNFTWQLPLQMSLEQPILNYVTSVETVRSGDLIPTDSYEVTTVHYNLENFTANGVDHYYFIQATDDEFFRPKQASENILFRFKLFFNFNPERVRFPSDSVNLPERQFTCTTGTESPTPTPVENITITSYTVDSTMITLNVIWREPLLVNGALDHYRACLSTRELEGQEEPPNTRHHFCTTITNNMSEASITFDHVRDDLYCRFFQMRASNEFVPGNWSEPQVIYLNTEGSCSDPGFARVSDGVIIGVPVTICLILTLCGVCACVCLLRWARRRKRNWEISDVSTGLDSMFGPAVHAPLFTGDSKHLEVDEWEIPPTEVIMEQSLGEGAFGEVYKGLLKGPLRCTKLRPSLRNAIAVPVAIKILKDSARGSERQDFLSEIDMMKSISEGQNPNVIGMVGCVTLQEPLSLILEFVAFGDLLSYLRTTMKMNSGHACDDDPYLLLGSIETVDLVRFSYQIASGMEYLSSLGIVHRDLACRNVLVDEGKVLKITDFGMSREVDEIYVQQSKGRVPLKWMALESILTRQFTSASDVWSYGIVLWEISTMGGFPYPTISNEELILQLKNGYRMERPENCSPEIYEIMLACWESDSSRRPTFSTLKAKFDSMLQSNVDYIYFLPVIGDKACYKPEKTTESNGAAPNKGSFLTPGVGLSFSNPSISNGHASPRGHTPGIGSPATASPYRNGPRLTAVKRVSNAYVDNPSLAQHVRSSSMHFVQPPRNTDLLPTRGSLNQKRNSVFKRKETSDGDNLWRGYVNMQANGASAISGSRNGQLSGLMRSDGDLTSRGMEVVNPVFDQGGAVVEVAGDKTRVGLEVVNPLFDQHTEEI